MISMMYSYKSLNHSLSAIQTIYHSLSAIQIATLMAVTNIRGELFSSSGQLLLLPEVFQVLCRKTCLISAAIKPLIMTLMAIPINTRLIQGK
jgi:hypothetical protein